jgi:hypothetical protein
MRSRPAGYRQRPTRCTNHAKFGAGEHAPLRGSCQLTYLSGPLVPSNGASWLADVRARGSDALA